MAVVNDLIKLESDGTISFGDYTADTKKKLQDLKKMASFYSKPFPVRQYITFQ